MAEENILPLSKSRFKDIIFLLTDIGIAAKNGNLELRQLLLKYDIWELINELIDMGKEVLVKGGESEESGKGSSKEKGEGERRIL